MMPHTHLMQAQACPVCAHPLDAMSSMDADHFDAPKEGDITLCISCASILVLDSEIKFSIVTRDMLEEMSQELQDEVTHIQQMLRSSVAGAASC